MKRANRIAILTFVMTVLTGASVLAFGCGNSPQNSQNARSNVSQLQASGFVKPGHSRQRQPKQYSVGNAGCIIAPKQISVSWPIRQLPAELFLVGNSVPLLEQRK
jgi:hypothetical protein